MRAIGPPLTDDERVAFIAAARKRVRLPFKHRGRSTRSVDCVGLLVLALRDIGRPVLDRRAYGRNPHEDGLEEAVRANLGEPVSGPLRPGDVVVMRQKGEPCHVALVAEHDGALTLIHSNADFRMVVEHRLVEGGALTITKAFRP